MRDPGPRPRGVSCVVDELRVDDGPLSFEFTGRCAYEATFDYSSADA